MSSPAPRIAYFYNDELADLSYGPDHPIKPIRVRLAHNLIGSYGMLDRLKCYSVIRLPKADLCKFHTGDFITFLEEVEPGHQQVLSQYAQQQQKRQEEGLPVEAPSEQLTELAACFTRFGVDEDCPIFPGLWEFCQRTSGGSVAGTWKLNRGAADIAIHWAGGLRDGAKAECRRFCYTNDVILAILELLRYHQKVLYINIDAEHAVGVEEAFYLTDRVMTVSFHQARSATGALTNTGAGQGKGYKLNFPLQDGIDDDSYTEIFQSIIGNVATSFKPDAVVLQCGASSLAGDKLGTFNLTLQGHGACVSFCKSLRCPLLLLGGGGANIANASRVWTYETAIALGIEQQLSDELPLNEYSKFWAPHGKLHLDPDPKRVNRNERAQLQRTQCALLQQLKELGGPPSVSPSTIAAASTAGDLCDRLDERAAAAQEEASMDQAGDASGAFATEGTIARPRDASERDSHSAAPDESARTTAQQQPVGQQLESAAQSHRSANAESAFDGASPKQ